MSFTSGSKGGTFKEFLTVEQIPEHYHEQVVCADTHNLTGIRSDYQTDITNGGAFPQGVNTEPTGGNQPHNNLPPYQVVYRWRRIA